MSFQAENNYDHTTGYYAFDDDASTVPYDPDVASQLSYHSHSPIFNSPPASPVISINNDFDNASFHSFSTLSPEIGALSRASSSPPASPQPNPFVSPLLSPTPPPQQSAPVSPLLLPARASLFEAADDHEVEAEVEQVEDDPMDIDSDDMDIDDDESDLMRVDWVPPSYPWWYQQ